MNTFKKLKAYATRTDYCVPLTIAQWDMLTAMDQLDMECVDCKAFEKFGKDICRVEFNGHFGCNFFFSDTGKPDRMLRGLTKLLKIHPVYLEGLTAGESGCALDNPYKLPETEYGEPEHPVTNLLKEALFEAGWQMGKEWGSEVVITMGFDEAHANLKSTKQTTKKLKK